MEDNYKTKRSTQVTIEWHVTNGAGYHPKREPKPYEGSLLSGALYALDIRSEALRIERQSTVSVERADARKRADIQKGKGWGPLPDDFDVDNTLDEMKQYRQSRMGKSPE